MADHHGAPDDGAPARNERVTMRDTSVFDVASSPNHLPHEHLSVYACLAECERAGTRRAVAEALVADAMLDMADWARAALGRGASPAEVARACGVSRTTVYSWQQAT